MPDPVCRAIRPFGTSIFTEMTVLANRHGAVNLSQGFPDFDGPDSIKQAAAQAILDGPNQYSPSSGQPELLQAIAHKMDRFYDLEVDPGSQVTVTAGATEGLSATLLGLLNPGDEVILIEPFYDLYPAVVARAGARAVYVPLNLDDLSLDGDALWAAFSERTRAIIVNNPQNPCGKVYTREELALIGQLCQRYDAVAIGDEVYEHLTFDEHHHLSLLQIPELSERAIVISSTAKTFSMTGWKVGWAVASAELSRAVRAAHQFLTFSTPGPLQLAMAQGIGMADSYYEQLRSDYAQRRQLLCGALEGMGFKVRWPQGSYYASVDISSLDYRDDLDFCTRLTGEVGVAAIPSSFFHHERSAGRDWVRFCFCKRRATLQSAIDRLERASFRPA